LNTGREANYSCPCCSYLTFGEKPPGTYLICPVCGWEDDFVQFDDPTYKGGANSVSLIEAKENFSKFGAATQSKAKSTRPPKDDEIPS
jgi:hypothetical protein